MCGGGGGDASDEIEKSEKRRQLAVTQGMANINRSFSGFDDGFYQGVRDNTVGMLKPQVERQRKKAERGLGFTLANRGLLGSSFGKEAATDLAFETEQANQAVVNQGNETVREVKRQVQNEKNNSTGLLIQSQDPNLAAQQAIGAAASISVPSPIAPLGNLFQSFANTYLSYQVGKTYGPPPPAENGPRVQPNSGRNTIQR